MIRLILLTSLIVLCSALMASARSAKEKFAFAHGIYGFDPRSFAKECVKCENEAERYGRSVGGFCPSQCFDGYFNEPCTSKGLNCPPAPRQ